MTRVVVLLALIGAIIALLMVAVVPVYAADCPQPSEMISVTIDVKPGSCPNPINLKSEGLLPVALLGSAEFNVIDVELSTVQLHPMDRCEQAVAPVRYAFADVDGDGFVDIVFHFVAKEVGFQPGDTGACLHGTLEGSGQHFCGHDAIVVIGY